ncbi:MAG: hypothetical protein Q4C29_01150 [bacterium]|nr:hypothetical protein [bacterium]
MNNTCKEETISTVTTCPNRSSGLLIAVVLYILLVIILGSFRGY